MKPATSLASSRTRMDLNEAMFLIEATWQTEPFIAFDPKVQQQYFIRRTCSHDGTMMFTFDLVLQAMAPLLSRTSYFKPMGPPPPGMEPRYTIGRIKLFGAYGRVEVKAGNIEGILERVSIPVRCEYAPICTP